MDKGQVVEVFSTLERMDKERKAQQDKFQEMNDAFRKQREDFEEKYSVKRENSPYAAYARMLGVGRIKSVRDTLKNEFVEFSRCVKTSKTWALCQYELDAKVGKRMITVGKFGLGIRWNMKSSEISQYDVEKIAKHSVELVAALKVKKKVLEAEAIEKFFSDGVGVLLSTDDRAEVAYEEELPEKFPVMLDSYDYNVMTADLIRVSWDSDGEASLVLLEKGKEKVFALQERYRTNNFRVEATVPFVVPLMDGFVKRAKEYAVQEIQKRETLVQTATAPLMPYIMARRL